MCLNSQPNICEKMGLVCIDSDKYAKRRGLYCGKPNPSTGNNGGQGAPSTGSSGVGGSANGQASTGSTGVAAASVNDQPQSQPSQTGGGTGSNNNQPQQGPGTRMGGSVADSAANQPSQPAAVPGIATLPYGVNGKICERIHSLEQP